MNLVNPIRYIFYSNLSVDALKKALSDEIIPTNMIPQKYYYGIQFDGEYHPDGSFIIKKTDWNYWGRHCKPHVYGTVMNENNETKVEIEIKPKLSCFLTTYIIIAIHLIASLVSFILYDNISYQGYLLVAFFWFLVSLFEKRRFKRKAYELITPLTALLDAKKYYRVYDSDK